MTFSRAYYNARFRFRVYTTNAATSRDLNDVIHVDQESGTRFDRRVGCGGLGRLGPILTVLQHARTAYANIIIMSVTQGTATGDVGLMECGPQKLNTFRNFGT